MVSKRVHAFVHACMRVRARVECACPWREMCIGRQNMHSAAVRWRHQSALSENVTPRC